MPDPSQIIIRRPGQPPTQIMLRRPGQDSAPLPPQALVDLAEGMTRGRTFDMSGDALLDPAAGAIGAKFTNQGLVPGTGSRPERGARVVLPLAAGAMTGGMSIPAAAAIEGTAYGLGNKADDGDFLLPAIGGALGSAATRGVIKGGGAVIRMARQPSTAVAARQATLAERAAAEATRKAHYTARADQLAAENAAKQATHELNQDARQAAALKRYNVAKAEHDAAELARVQRETAAREMALARQAEQEQAIAKHVQETQGRLAQMKPTNIVTERPVTIPGSESGLVLPSEGLQTTQFQLPSQATRETEELARKMALLRRAGVAPAPGTMPGAAPSTTAIKVPDVNPAAGYRDFAPPPRQAFRPATLPEYVPTTHAELPPVTGPQTRGSEVAWDAAKMGAKYGLLPAALYGLWDKYVR